MEKQYYNEEDLARMCEVAVILSNYETQCEDLHDFYSDHVKPLFNAWLLQNGTGVYKCLDESEEAYVTEYANRVAQSLYKRRQL